MRAVAFTAAVLALACGSPSPRETVSQYCDALPHDPVSALLVLGPEVQLAHGLRIPLAEALQPSLIEPPPPPTVATAEIAWLHIWKDPWLAGEAAGLRFEIVSVRETDDSAEVDVRVVPTLAPAFDQRFELSRAGADGRWRIVAIEQGDVPPASAPAAFAAAPTIERLRTVRTIAAGEARRAARPPPSK